MDGGLGHGNQPINSRYTISREESIAVDNYKDECAKSHGIIVIRIDSNYPCVDDRFDYIKNNILSSDLQRILDLSLVDWEKCKLDAESTLLFQISSLWDNGEHVVKNIATILNINPNTVMRYLKKSEQLGISTYNHFDYLWENNRLVYARCMETGELVLSLNKANKKYKCNINGHLKGLYNFAGILSDGTKLHWNQLSKQETYEIYKSINSL